MHLFDSEDQRRSYRKNIDKEIIKAYKEALEYTKNRIKGYCESRGADYMLVTAEDSLSDILLSKLIDNGVLK